MNYRLLWAAAAFGVVLHLAGLGWDAYMHAKDSTLAAREGIFTLGNPSHALIIAGLGITTASLLGVAFLWAQERSLGGTGTVATMLRAGTLPCVALGAAGAIWLASLAEDNSGHAHGDAMVHADGHEHLDASTLDPTVARFLIAHHNAEATGDHDHAAVAAADTGSMGEGNAHTHGTEIPLTPEHLQGASEFYARVKVATAKWEDINQAMADGYGQITPDLPGIAAHFINGRYNSDGKIMSPEEPEILLYSKRMDGSWRLVGAMFSSEVASETPPSLFGPLDVWHRHENLCFTAGAQVSVKASAAECVAGVFLKTTAWNLHVWTAPGAEGVFAHDFAPITPGAFPAATRPAAQDLVARR
ncbi:MAG: hypothetical protein WD557_17365 [Dehalococcoidia bacterium]